MKTLHLTVAVCGLLLTSLAGHPAWADVFNMPAGQKSLEFVTVGDLGNAADTLIADGSLGYGAVDYAYGMGQFEVTAAQYTVFLNAVAATDAYGLYNPSMGDVRYKIGCGIIRSGISGHYTYSVAPGRENLPVNYVSWPDCARFANWLNNGQSTGSQGPGTTETGSYTLNGKIDDFDIRVVTRSPGARYVVPNEDEWYKAAYYKGGSNDAGYWSYPTRSDTPPSNILSTTGSNNANCVKVTYADPVNFLTPVGYFASAPGSYGTFDQAGNVWEWTEAFLYAGYRGLRGGSYSGPDYHSHSGFRFYWPTQENDTFGFRVVQVPEPATLALLALGGLLIARRRR